MSHIEEVVPDAPAITALTDDDQLWLFENFSRLISLLETGVSGNFTTADGKAVTVINGLITSIV